MSLGFVIAAGTRCAVQAANPGRQMDLTITARISAIHREARTITTEGAFADKTFHIGPDAEIEAGGNEFGDIHDLKAGDRVDVTYRVQHGELVAIRIARVGA